MIRIGVDGVKYFKSIWNIVDVVCFISIVALLTVFYAAEMHQKKQNQMSQELEEDDIMGLMIMFIRYLIQTVRFIVAIKEFKNIRNSLKTSEIKMDDVQMTDRSQDIKAEQGQEFGKDLENYMKNRPEQITSCNKADIELTTVEN